MRASNERAPAGRLASFILGSLLSGPAAPWPLTAGRSAAASTAWTTGSSSVSVAGGPGGSFSGSALAAGSRWRGEGARVPPHHACRLPHTPPLPACRALAGLRGYRERPALLRGRRRRRRGGPWAGWQQPPAGAARRLAEGLAGSESRAGWAGGAPALWPGLLGQGRRPASSERAVEACRAKCGAPLPLDYIKCY